MEIEAASNDGLSLIGEIAAYIRHRQGDVLLRPMLGSLSAPACALVAIVVFGYDSRIVNSLERYFLQEGVAL